jgi:phosphatidate cytidylyltransferase
MLASRVFLSLLLIPGFILLFIMDHRQGASAPILFFVANLLAVRGSWEMVQLLRTRNFEPRFRLVFPSNLLIVSSCWWYPLYYLDDPLNMPTGLALLGPTMMTFSLVVLMLFFTAALRFREPGKSMETLGSELLMVVYVGLLLSMTTMLRWVAGAEAGYLILGSLIISTKGGDIGAYTLGRMFGQKKLFPRLSPGKTWWGARGALLMSAFLSVLWLHYMPSIIESGWPPCRLAWSLLYGITIGIVGIVGDLCESLIKRDVGKKDAATLMPGFGGILDVLDSILYAGPVAYLMWSAAPLAGWMMPQ